MMRRRIGCIPRNRNLARLAYLKLVISQEKPLYVATINMPIYGSQVTGTCLGITRFLGQSWRELDCRQPRWLPGGLPG